VGWWFMDNHPGRVAEELADPALIAIQARDDSLHLFPVFKSDKNNVWTTRRQ